MKKRNNIGNLKIYLLIFIMFVILLNILVSINGMRLRSWVNIINILVILLSTISITIVRIKDCINKKRIQLALILISVIFIFSAFSFVMVYFFEYSINRERVDVIDGERFVGYEDSFWDHSIDYYKYINIFVCGTERKFSLYDVKKGSDGRNIYYDMDGNVIHHLDELYEYKYN